MCLEIKLVFKNDKPCLQTLGMVAQKMLLLEMPGQTTIVLEPLVVLALLFTNVTLVVLLVQVLVQIVDVVKTFRPAKLANRMPVEPRAGPVSLFQVVLELAGSKPGQLAYEIALVIDAQLTNAKPVLVPQMIQQQSSRLLLLFRALLVFVLVQVLVDKDAIVDRKVALVAGKFVERNDCLFVVVFLKKHAHVLFVDEPGSDFVAPAGIVLESFGIVLVDNDGIVGCFANGTFLVLVQMSQPQMANPAHVVVAAGKLGPHVRPEVAEANEASIGLLRCQSRHGFDCLYMVWNLDSRVSSMKMVG